MESEQSPEHVNHYQCNIHLSKCDKCPDCNQYSYCRNCLFCKQCSYPHISIHQKPEHRFWVHKGVFCYVIQDRETDKVYSPRELFDVPSSEYRRCHLSFEERRQVADEIGYGTCIAILQHCFFFLKKPYNAKDRFFL
jgi:hypothetical protein